MQSYDVSQFQFLQPTKIRFRYRAGRNTRTFPIHFQCPLVSIDLELSRNKVTNGDELCARVALPPPGTRVAHGALPSS
jgi:hypothetical protein